MANPRQHNYIHNNRSTYFLSFQSQKSSIDKEPYQYLVIKKQQSIMRTSTQRCRPKIGRTLWAGGFKLFLTLILLSFITQNLSAQGGGTVTCPTCTTTGTIRVDGNP